MTCSSRKSHRSLRSKSIYMYSETALDALLLQMDRMHRYLSNFRRALWLALKHDVLNTAKAAAYSGMLMFFPGLVVLTTLVAKVPEGPTLVGEIRSALEQFLPAETMS